MARHKKIVVEMPAWVEALTSNDACLRSVAEDVYTSKAFAKALGADNNERCTGLMQAAKKSVTMMENGALPAGKRCSAGDRAARKYWEAKVCARNE